MRYLLPVMLMLAGCFSRTVAFPGGATTDAGGRPPSGILGLAPDQIVILAASAITAAGCLLIAAAIVLLILGRRKLAGTCVAAGGACIVCGPILGWVGHNLWWIAILVGLAGAVVALLVARRYLHRIEAALGLDINRDGKVGIAVDYTDLERAGRSASRDERGFDDQSDTGTERVDTPCLSK